MQFQTRAGSWIDHPREANSDREPQERPAQVEAAPVGCRGPEFPTLALPGYLEYLPHSLAARQECHLASRATLLPEQPPPTVDLPTAEL